MCARVSGLFSNTLPSDFAPAINLAATIEPTGQAVNARQIFMIRILYFLAMFALVSVDAVAQDTTRISNVERRVSRLEGKGRQVTAVGGVGFLFGAFCALWAQNSGRSAWLWFFLGFIFSVIAVLVLLSKNSGDVDRQRSAGKKPFNLQDFREQ